MVTFAQHHSNVPAIVLDHDMRVIAGRDWVSQQYCRSSFALRTALLAIPFVSVRCGVDIQWFQERCLFRDSQLSLRTLWSAVIKSPNLAVRGTAPPLRLLHGALVILVRLQISQFRSLGKWVYTLCLPRSSRLFLVGSKETSWEELAWEPPCNGISSSTKFALNSCSHSGQNLTSFSVLSWFLFYLFLGFRWLGFPQVSLINHHTGFPVLSWSLFHWIWVFGWLGFPQVSPFYHQPNSDTGTCGEMSL